MAAYPDVVRHKNGIDYFWQAGKIIGYSSPLYSCLDCRTPVEGKENMYFRSITPDKTTWFLCGDCATGQPAKLENPLTAQHWLAPEPSCVCPMHVGAWGIAHSSSCAWVKWNEGRKVKPKGVAAAVTSTQPVARSTACKHDWMQFKYSSNHHDVIVAGTTSGGRVCRHCSIIACPDLWRSGSCHTKKHGPSTPNGVICGAKFHAATLKCELIL